MEILYLLVLSAIFYWYLYLLNIFFCICERTISHFHLYLLAPPRSPLCTIFNVYLNSFNFWYLYLICLYLDRVLVFGLK